jgi:ATP-dependent phosphoenolpyruvate carboxykinase
MSQDGRPSAFGLEEQGFRNLKAVHWNLTAPALYEEAVARGEGHVAKNGPLVVLTGQHTGRSATDKFVVRDAASEKQVWWDNNKAMSPAHFDALYADMMKFAEGPRAVRERICSAAPIYNTACRCASSPNMPGTRCSCISF